MDILPLDLKNQNGAFDQDILAIFTLKKVNEIFKNCL